jgi:hypothetical protein
LFVLFVLSVLLDACDDDVRAVLDARDELLDVLFPREVELRDQRFDVFVLFVLRAPPPYAPPPALLPGGVLALAFGVFALPPEPTAFVTTVRAIMYVSIPGRLLPAPPVVEGLSPIRIMIPSIFLPTLAIAMMKITHGIHSGPGGIWPAAEMNIFIMTTLSTIIKHIVAYIRTQPLKISAVFRLPPVANAHGASIVSSPTRKYLSPIARNSFTSCHMSTKPRTMTSSHDAPMAKTFSSGNDISTASGIMSKSISVDDNPSPMLHICLLASRQNPNTKVLANSSLGSSPSKPRPAIMLFAA